MIGVSEMAIPGQRISLFVDIWKEAGADPSLQHLVKFGHKIQFGEEGPPPCTLPLPKYETKLPATKIDIVRAEVQQLLLKGAVRKVSCKEAEDVLGHYSTIFTVPKQGGKHGKNTDGCLFIPLHQYVSPRPSLTTQAAA